MSNTENQIGGAPEAHHVFIPNIDEAFKEAVDEVTSRTGLGPTSLKEQLFFDYFQSHNFDVDGETTMEDMQSMDRDLFGELEKIYTDETIDQFLSKYKTERHLN